MKSVLKAKSEDAQENDSVLSKDCDELCHTLLHLDHILKCSFLNSPISREKVTDQSAYLKRKRRQDNEESKNCIVGGKNGENTLIWEKKNQEDVI